MHLCRPPLCARVQALCHQQPSHPSPPHPSPAAFALAELAERAGVPPGALNVVSGDAPPISDALMASPVVRLRLRREGQLVGLPAATAACTLLSPR